MNDLIKRKKELDEEMDEMIQMDSDVANERSKITFVIVAKLIKKFNEISSDLVEILDKKENYDSKLTSVIEKAIADVADKFSNIQPPTINIAAPNVKFDLQLLQPVLNKLGEQNGTLINLISKYNNNQNENLLKLITSVVEKQILFLEREVKEKDYTQQFSGLEKAINNRPTEFKSKVTNYNNQGRIDEITTKVIK